MFFYYFFFHLHSSLLAVSLDDFEIQVVDIDMRRIVRIFRGHTNRVTDMVSGDVIKQQSTFSVFT